MGHAWYANGDRGGTSGNVREGTKGEGSGCDAAPTLSARDPELPLWKFVSTTVGADGGMVLPATCAEIHTSIMERTWGGVHCSWRRASKWSPEGPQA